MPTPDPPWECLSTEPQRYCSHLHSAAQHPGPAVPYSPATDPLLRAFIVAAVIDFKEDTRPPVHILRVLCDSGALNSSYINPDLVKSTPWLQELIQPCDTSVRLGDGQTEFPIQERILLPIIFTDDDGMTYSTRSWIYLFKTGYDLIVGLRLITSQLLPYFTKLMYKAAEVQRSINDLDNGAQLRQPPQTTLLASLQQCLRDITSQATITEWTIADELEASPESFPAPFSSVLARGGESSEPFAPQADLYSLCHIICGNDLIQGDLIPPFTSSAEDAPEDDLDPPSDFGNLLNYLAIPDEQAITEMKELLNKHVNPDFAAATEIIPFLLKNWTTFYPRDWTGIDGPGIEPCELQWKEGMPSSYKPPSSTRINPDQLVLAKAEFDRLCTYMFKPSSSPYAHRVVIAPKATYPHIRLAGSYDLFANKWMIKDHRHIPDPRTAIMKCRGAKFYVDSDMTNSFHQMRLALHSRKFLAISTPWGQYEPVFVPEGITPASGWLQRIVHIIFEDFSEWMIFIFDNFLIIAATFEQLYERTVLVISRCRKYNVHLKLPKCFFGFQEASFFGYILKDGHYTLSTERREHIMKIPMPQTKKQAQSFIGCSIFFAPFVAHHGEHLAPLADLAKDGFPFHDPSKWQHPYQQLFEDFKKAMCHAVSLYFPDPDQPMYLYTDASTRGVGGVLFQVIDGIIRILQLVSHKFSDAATRWATIEQEAYSIYYSVLRLEYFLRARKFILKTDHANLIFIERSIVPKIIRWRLYLQQYDFLLQHIPGKQNVVADWLSRLHEPIERIINHLFAASSVPAELAYGHAVSSLNLDSEVPSSHELPLPVEKKGSENIVVAAEHNSTFDPAYLPPIRPNARALLELVHGEIPRAHLGVKSTYDELQRRFPTHDVTQVEVRSFIRQCATCQKVRYRPPVPGSPEPMVRVLATEHHHSVVGVDTLHIGKDSFGNYCLDVVRNWTTKHTRCYPKNTHSAESTVFSLYHYFTHYGVPDAISTDPGSDFTSKNVEDLRKLLGMKHIISLVDWHTSNGVESSNKEVLRHLMAMFIDERVRDSWSHPVNICNVEHILNSTPSFETGESPNDLTFGSTDKLRFQIPSTPSDPTFARKYVAMLNDNLKLNREIAKKYRDSILQKRLQRNDDIPNTQYIADNLVIREKPESVKDKMLPGMFGPYVVLQQYKNDVTIRHMATGVVAVEHVSRLRPYTGNLADARRVAMADYDQTVIDRVVWYVGDINKRKSLEFKTIFADGDIRYKPFEQDLTSTIQFEDFCRSRQHLTQLLYSGKEAEKHKQLIMSAGIPTSIVAGTEFFMDIMYWGLDWYVSKQLPDFESNVYVTKAVVLERRGKKILISLPLFKLQELWDAWIFHLYFLYAMPSRGILVDQDFVTQYPQVLLLLHNAH